MTDEAFEQLVAEGYNSLPKWVTETIQNVALVVENEPSEELRKKEHLRNDETLLGYYTGVPLSERGDHYGIGMTLPDTVTIFKKPILESAEEKRTELTTDIEFVALVKKIISDTVWHEFAHHFGMNEEEVRALELSRISRNQRH